MYKENDMCVPVNESCVTKMDTIRDDLDYTTKTLIELDTELSRLIVFVFGESYPNRERIEINSFVSNVVFNKCLAEEIGDKLRAVCERFGC